jgi:competence ComEA-like helix-hairpin-helix protein
MFNFTPEERKVILFIFGLAFCGLALSNLVKVSAPLKKIVYPQVQLAKVDLNKVSLNELVDLRCVSAKLAQSILEYRNRRHEFTDLEELKEVKGVGDQRYEKLKEIFFIE